MRVGTVRAEAGDFDVDDVGPEPRNVLPAEADPLGPAGRGVLDDDVAPADECLEGGARRGVI